MATFYSREDAGAPAISYIPSTYNAAGYRAFKAVLKACLVDGYGTKPAAGWGLVNEGTNFLVLRNGANTGYVCFTLVGNATVTIYLAETYLGMAGDVIVGDGLKTGTAVNNTEPQRLGLWAVAYSATSTCWYVIADDRTCVLQMAGSDGSPRVLSVTGTQYTAALYIGEDSAGNFISMGGTNVATDSAGSAVDNFSHVGFTALKVPKTGFLVGAGSVNAQTPSLYFQGTANESTVFKLDKVPLSRPSWGDPTVPPGQVAGELRGIAQTPALMVKYINQSAQCLGFSGDMTTRNMNTPISLGDSNLYLMGGGYASKNLTRLVTNNPEFW